MSVEVFLIMLFNMHGFDGQEKHLLDEVLFDFIGTIAS